ncbi:MULTISPECIES: bifunctional glutamate N-acetyltransferase/amino-acid acetyltransferase ArgJ [Methylobacterium]|uniref:Arginine biosynthesis bifunctional protein ArgJ n=2 Tax=Pseudomonadota TaxID=1224 RepID=A0ABQ4T211_9HYPH|nr:MULTISPECIES: bifunctional glutamate N-acetyltransferase/amino-acid acetyltransferase ArgJ [Methylobacterium]PIU05860.1 MAG: bifunctional ornithine acetyltransferase/N-acetylglutamate synthase [Methylobacterium sp. CG09_land_8_20_14_0_10_71_15]PIU11839.1 MAG: bifunctional ornithine acetyltransferase/N-acetylglutamate synthase [Methylobacterium sp. CG08_land_8_20_14_0_20_71_15]GBU19076.1 arginine biosynthesis bifunctional protein ArgJ [Methylobacterium sp.]GJE08773.1 Arginine biosynthesis bif
MSSSKASPVSPLAPLHVPELPPIRGVRLATAEAGIRYAGRTDVLYVGLDAGTRAAGVFTRSRCPSAPVDWCREALKDGGARALVVNSGNANAFTGLKGREAVALTAAIAAKAAGCGDQEVYVASTGVIGEPLDARKFEGVLADCAASAVPGAEAWAAAARAIMTTDTFPKLATRTAEIGGVAVTINGFAKGAGMIAPDMATMLAFVFTDAALPQDVLQTLIAEGAADSFNCVTVDGDTSTSDTLLAFATGAAGNAEIAQASDRRLALFRAALNDLLEELAQLVARDGEGARKFVTVRVEGAESDASAHHIAMSIANSPLVKTAVAGEDANWGRVVMAVGKAGEPADRDRLAIWFGDVRVAVSGARDPDYSEDAASAVMREDAVTIRVDLGLGEGSARVWTCDLTKEYVAINGDYRS